MKFRTKNMHSSNCQRFFDYLKHFKLALIIKEKLKCFTHTHKLRKSIKNKKLFTKILKISSSNSFSNKQVCSTV